MPLRGQIDLGSPNSASSLKQNCELTDEKVSNLDPRRRDLEAAEVRRRNLSYINTIFNLLQPIYTVDSLSLVNTICSSIFFTLSWESAVH